MEAAGPSGHRDTASLPSDVVQFTAAYERLRACVVAETEPAGPRGGHAAGLGLVLQRGVAGWLRAQAAALSELPREEGTGPPQSRPQACTTAFAIAPEILPLARQSDLAVLIAGMVVSMQRTGRAFSKRAAISDTDRPERVRCP